MTSAERRDLSRWYLARTTHRKVRCSFNAARDSGATWTSMRAMAATAWTWRFDRWKEVWLRGDVDVTVEDTSNCRYAPCRSRGGAPAQVTQYAPPAIHSPGAYRTVNERVRNAYFIGIQPSLRGRVLRVSRCTCYLYLSGRRKNIGKRGPKPTVCMVWSMVPLHG